MTAPKPTQPDTLRCADGPWVEAVPESLPLTWQERVMGFVRRIWGRVKGWI